MNKTIRQLSFLLFLLLILIIFATHIIQDQRMTDSNGQLTKQINELQAENTELHKLNNRQAVIINEYMTLIPSDEKEELKKPSRGGERPKLLGEYTITAYCSCAKCCGKRDRQGGKVVGAAGVELTPGVSVASPLPFGTELIIGGKRYVVQDRTAGWIVDRYDGKIIDIYMSSHEAALTFGKQVCEVYKVD